ncbi:MAG: hypothetical protein IKN51_02000 [Bacteroidaceae bacterium]|nr:hypothetical protein [Bacteroidaceae bacterium]
MKQPSSASDAKPKATKSRKKKAVTLSLQDLITQPRQLAHLPMMNKVTGYRVLIAVLQRLQGLWRIAKMPQTSKSGQLYMNFVTDEFEVKRQKEAAYNEGDVVFKLRLSDIADDPHYDEARQALASLLHVHCFIPDPDNPGYYRTESHMQINGRRENGKFVGTEFEVIIPRLTAENILDINLFGNYTRFVGYTAGRLRSSFSYPLYIYLSEEWRHHGEHFVIPMSDLRFRLGFVKDSDDPEREHRYAAWSQFCDKVLNQAQRELKKLSETGGADFTFEYQGLLHGTPLPPYKRPDAVAFTILPTESGRTIKEENDYAPHRELAQKLMTEFFHLHLNQTRALLRRVTPPLMSSFIAQLQTWHDECLSGRHADVQNLPAWAYTSIDTFIREEEKKYFTAAEDVTATATSPATSSASAGTATVTGYASPLSSPSAAVCQPVSPADPAGPVSSAAISSQATPNPLTPAQARQLAQAALGGAGEQPRQQYDFTGARLTLTADEQQQLHAFLTDLQCTYATDSPAFIREVVQQLHILRVNDTRRVITFHLADGSHLTPDRLNYYVPGLYARFYALFNIYFPDGYKLYFD